MKRSYQKATQADRDLADKLYAISDWFRNLARSLYYGQPDPVLRIAKDTRRSTKETK